MKKHERTDEDVNHPTCTCKDCGREYVVNVEGGRHLCIVCANRRHQMKKPDTVNHPSHYTSHPSGIECIQITEHMNFCLGNALKYIWRAGEKGDAIEDLKKSRWYVDREIARRSKPKEIGRSMDGWTFYGTVDPAIEEERYD